MLKRTVSIIYDLILKVFTQDRTQPFCKLKINKNFLSNKQRVGYFQSRLLVNKN